MGCKELSLSLSLSLSVSLYSNILRLSRHSSQTDGKHTFRAAPQTELVTSACMLSSEFLCLDALHAPTYLWFYVGALKAVFRSSFSGITTSILQVSAACAFITRDQKLSSSRRLSAQTRHRTHRLHTEPEQLNNLIQLSRGSFAASV